MEAAQPHWELSEDRTTLTIVFPTTPQVRFRLSAETTDSLLQNVGMMRSAMVPQHSTDDPRGKKVEAILKPMWATELDLMLQDPLLHIRDPRFGILSYSIPREEAIRLGQTLIDLANSPAQAPPSETPN